jgi:hypothetical protein
VNKRKKQGKSDAQRCDEWGNSGPRHVAPEERLIGTQHVVPEHKISQASPQKVVKPKDGNEKALKKAMKDHLAKMNRGLKTY